MNYNWCVILLYSLVVYIRETQNIVFTSLYTSRETRQRRFIMCNVQFIRFITLSVMVLIYIIGSVMKSLALLARLAASNTRDSSEINLVYGSTPFYVHPVWYDVIFSLLIVRGIDNAMKYYVVMLWTYTHETNCFPENRVDNVPRLRNRQYCRRRIDLFIIISFFFYHRGRPAYNIGELKKRKRVQDFRISYIWK